MVVAMATILKREKIKTGRQCKNPTKVIVQSFVCVYVHMYTVIDMWKTNAYAPYLSVLL